jgi:hypothetical protein
MVKGMDRFKTHFAGFHNQYVLIGGAACYLAMAEAGLDFRVTKDLDIVLCVEALNAEFGQAFWDFIDQGGYRNRQQSSGKNIFYRFDHPRDGRFPDMLELFAKVPDALSLADGSQLTPIPLDEQLSSLSAILMEDAYYRFIHESKIEIDGVSVAPPECLIPLKARAWLDLVRIRESGQRIDQKNIKKHKNDVFRLYQVLEPARSMRLRGEIRKDFQQFLAALEADQPVNVRQLGLGGITDRDVIRDLREYYHLGG